MRGVARPACHVAPGAGGPVLEIFPFKSRLRSLRVLNGLPLLSKVTQKPSHNHQPLSLGQNLFL